MYVFFKQTVNNMTTKTASQLEMRHQYNLGLPEHQQSIINILSDANFSF